MVRRTHGHPFVSVRLNDPPAPTLPSLSLTLPLSLSLSLSHTHTHIRARARAHTHTAPAHTCRFACRCGLRILSLPHVTLNRLDSLLVPQPGQSAAQRSWSPSEASGEALADRVLPVESAASAFGHVRRDLPTPLLVAKSDRVVAMPTPLRKDRARVRLGVPLRDLMHADTVGSLDDELVGLFRDEAFISCVRWRGRSVLVLTSLKTQLEEEGHDTQNLRAAIFSCVLRRRLLATSRPASRESFRVEVREALGEYHAVFHPLCESLLISGWAVGDARLVTGTYRVQVDEYAL